MSYNLPKSFEILPLSDEIDLTVVGVYDLFTIFCRVGARYDFQTGMFAEQSTWTSNIQEKKL